MKHTPEDLRAFMEKRKRPEWKARRRGAGYTNDEANQRLTEAGDG